MYIIKNIIILVVTVYLITLVYLNINISNNKDTKVDVIIILGAKVKKEQPTLLLQQRLNTALEYYHRNPQVNIIVSGGQGSDEFHPEAKIMKKYLIEHKVPKTQLYVEDKSTSTFENIVNSKALIDKHKLGDKIGIVTNAFHIKRASIIADNIFKKRVEVIVAPNCQLKYSWKSILREPLAFFKSLLWDRD